MVKLANMWEEIFELFPQRVTENLPQFLWAILVFLIGWLISKWAGGKVAMFLRKTRLNQALKRLGFEETLTKIDTRLNAPKFFGELIRWSLFILFLIACLEIVGAVEFTQFLKAIVIYIPNIFIASYILIVAVFLSDFSQKIVVGSFKKEKITYSGFLGKGISSAIWILAILAILYQLKIVPTLILTIFVGVIAIIVLAIGISFGLGGKDLAARILKELENKFK